MMYAMILVAIVFTILMVIDKRPRNSSNHWKLVGDNFTYAFMISLSIGFVIFSAGWTLMSLATLYKWIFTSLSLEILSFQFLIFLIGFFTWICAIYWGTGMYNMIKEYLKKNAEQIKV